MYKIKNKTVKSYKIHMGDKNKKLQKYIKYKIGNGKI